MPNERGRGRICRLMSDDATAIEAFARQHDVPGRGVYECVAELRADAQRRARDTVAALPFLHVDIDLRALDTPRDKVLAKLKKLPLRAELRDSGGGFHVIFHLKEPVEVDTPEFQRANELRTKLTHLFCGDPAPNHCAALLRRLNTHNSKYGDSRLCHVIQKGEAADITEIEALLDASTTSDYEASAGLSRARNASTSCRLWITPACSRSGSTARVGMGGARS
jgi:hypothetical protein